MAWKVTYNQLLPFMTITVSTQWYDCNLSAWQLTGIYVICSVPGSYNCHLWPFQRKSDSFNGCGGKGNKSKQGHLMTYLMIVLLNNRTSGPNWCDKSRAIYIHTFLFSYCVPMQALEKLNRDIDAYFLALIQSINCSVNQSLGCLSAFYLPTLEVLSSLASLTLNMNKRSYFRGGEREEVFFIIFGL